jgi:DNA-binding response OmpR family regulator
MARILVIEDEEKMARMLSRVLRDEGHVAETAGDGRTGLSRALDDSFDLLIVDWMLPERSGVQVVRALRAADVNTPVLMLTARGQVEDRVEGLDAGADDYLPKPFALQELLARVRALTRRPRETGEATKEISAGDVALDPVRHVVRRGGERIDLTAREFALLATLIQRPGQVFTRSLLLATIWVGTRDVYTNVVDLYVSHLRKKLDRAGEPSHIRTVRGIGYAYESRDGAP